MKYILLLPSFILLLFSCCDTADTLSLEGCDCYYHISGDSILIDSVTKDGIYYRLTSGDWVRNNTDNGFSYIDCDYDVVTKTCID